MRLFYYISIAIGLFCITSNTFADCLQSNLPPPSSFQSAWDAFNASIQGGFSLIYCCPLKKEALFLFGWNLLLLRFFKVYTPTKILLFRSWLLFNRGGWLWFYIPFPISLSWILLKEASFLAFFPFYARLKKSFFYPMPVFLKSRFPRKVPLFVVFFFSYFYSYAVDMGTGTLFYDKSFSCSALMNTEPSFGHFSIFYRLCRSFVAEGSQLSCYQTALLETLFEKVSCWDNHPYPFDLNDPDDKENYYLNIYPFPKCPAPKITGCFFESKFASLLNLIQEKRDFEIISKRINAEENRFFLEPFIQGFMPLEILLKTKNGFFHKDDIPGKVSKHLKDAHFDFFKNSILDEKAIFYDQNAQPNVSVFYDAISNKDRQGNTSERWVKSMLSPFDRGLDYSSLNSEAEYSQINMLVKKQIQQSQLSIPAWSLFSLQDLREQENPTQNWASSIEKTNLTKINNAKSHTSLTNAFLSNKIFDLYLDYNVFLQRERFELLLASLMISFSNQDVILKGITDELWISIQDYEKNH